MGGCEEYDKHCDLHHINKSTLAFAITLAMFSLAGIPPLAGFIANTW
jgi:NADH:ubiquinone oxidoreductase subunit 2 (subunit N)